MCSAMSDDNTILLNRVKCGLQTNDKHMIHNALSEFVKTHCNSPYKVTIRNRFTGNIEEQYFSCGKCPHCKNAYSNDLTTRIELDARLLKHLYFVTLTYSSYYPSGDKVYGYYDAGSYNHPNYVKYELSDKVINILKRNVLHLDADNFRQKRCYTTCLANMNDYSSFIKRLRSCANGVYISHLGISEYGEKHAHPHFHALIASDQPLTRDQFLGAWSLAGSPIGTCYIEDLFADGTMSGVSALNVKKCVSYVVKYMRKNSDFNDKRLKYAYYYFKKLYSINGVSLNSSYIVSDDAHLIHNIDQSCVHFADKRVFVFQTIKNRDFDFTINNEAS